MKVTEQRDGAAAGRSHGQAKPQTLSPLPLWLSVQVFPWPWNCSLCAELESFLLRRNWSGFQ